MKNGKMTYSELGKEVRIYYDKEHGNGTWQKLPKEKKAFYINEYLNKRKTA